MGIHTLQQTQLLNCNYSLFFTVNVPWNHFIALNTAWEWPIYRYWNMWKMRCAWVWAVLKEQEGEKDANVTGWLLWCRWQFASRLSIYDYIRLFIPFAIEEAAFPGWYLILWQIQRWWNPWGTNKWVSKLSVLLCWHCISQHFTNFPGSCFFTASKYVRVHPCQTKWGAFWCKSSLLLIHTASHLMPSSIAYPALLHSSSPPPP